LPEGVGAAVFAVGQFFLVGLPIATLVGLTDLFRIRMHRGRTLFSLSLCLLAWSVAAWWLAHRR